MAPLRRHTLQELQILRHDDLVDLVLDLEATVAGLQAAAAASTGRASAENLAPQRSAEGLAPQRSAESSVPQRAASTSPRLTTTADEPGPEDRQRLVASPLAPAKLERALSKIPANTAAASQLRAELAQAVESMVLERQGSSQECNEQGRELRRLTHSNFFLPDLRDREPEFATYIRSKLVAPYHQEALEEAKALNWAVGRDLSEEHRLHVLWTQSDGNCLLHATLLAMWGLHDTQEVGGTGGLSTLRAAMSRLFQEPRVAEPIRRRWALQICRDSVWEPQSQERACSDASLPPRPGNVEISEAQLAREWAEMVELASRPNAFLDSVHVLALAHALRRPIVILASPMQRDPFGVPLTPIFFRGIYLPFERKPAHCCRQPLVLCFQDAHFMPLVPLAAPKGGSPVLVPLADGHGQELPLRFAEEEELERKWELVREYLEIEPDMHLTKAKITCNMALLRRDSSHALVSEMMTRFVERGEATFASEREAEREAERRAAAPQQRLEPRTPGCKRQAGGEQEAETVKRQRQGEGPRPAAQVRSEGVPGTMVAAKAPTGTGKACATAAPAEDEEPDATVTDRWPVRLPKGVGPGDRSRFHMPKNCTEPSIVDFKVPRGRFEGDIVVLTSTFKVKGRCIKALREVTQLSRERAVELLAKTHGDADAAAREHFELEARSPA